MPVTKVATTTEAILIMFPITRTVDGWSLLAQTFDTETCKQKLAVVGARGQIEVTDIFRAVEVVDKIKTEQSRSTN